MKKRRTGASVFLFGALGYPALEILWRGDTHPTMSLAGGICALLLFLINRRLAPGSLPLRLLASGAAITLTELTFGVIFNLALGLDVWDYSSLPLHLFGQICLPYSLLWCLLALPFCLLCPRRRKSVSAP